MRVLRCWKNDAARIPARDFGSVGALLQQKLMPWIFVHVGTFFVQSISFQPLNEREEAVFLRKPLFYHSKVWQKISSEDIQRS